MHGNSLCSMTQDFRLCEDFPSFYPSLFGRGKKKTAPMENNFKRIQAALIQFKKKWEKIHWNKQKLF